MCVYVCVYTYILIYTYVYNIVSETSSLELSITALLNTIQLVSSRKL